MVVITHETILEYVNFFLERWSNGCIFVWEENIYYNVVTRWICGQRLNAWLNECKDSMNDNDVLKHIHWDYQKGQNLLTFYKKINIKKLNKNIFYKRN